MLTTRIEAREALLRKWKLGNFKWGHTEYCPQHKAWHVAHGLRPVP